MPRTSESAIERQGASKKGKGVGRKPYVGPCLVDRTSLLWDGQKPRAYADGLGRSKKGTVCLLQDHHDLSRIDERSFTLVDNSYFSTCRIANNGCDFGCYFLARIEPDRYRRAFFVFHFSPSIRASGPTRGFSRSSYKPNDQANDQEGAEYSESKHCVSPVF